uniref:Uncharacterized protein n=2 Tax=Aegilops tauschii subsp. strangulata TaxID=200361 RepID=A0A453M776_AEGTS
MDAGSSSSPLHIVVVPWLAFGHLLPYLELSERLAERGHRVSYVSTPRNLARLPTLRPAAAPRMDLVALPLPRVDGLPDGAESTNDVPDDKRELHFKAFDGLAAPFAEFMAAACADEATRPHWVIADCFHHWVAAAAFEHKVRQICARCRRLVPLIPSHVGVYLKSCSMLHRSPGPMRDTSPDRGFDRYRAPRPADGSAGCDPHPPSLRGGGGGTNLRRPWRVGHVHRPALLLDQREVCARGHQELRRVGARVLPAGANGHRPAGRAPRPSAAVTRRRPPCGRHQRISRACHRALAGRAACGFGCVRSAGE